MGGDVLHESDASFEHLLVFLGVGVDVADDRDRQLLQGLLHQVVVLHVEVLHDLERSGRLLLSVLVLEDLLEGADQEHDDLLVLLSDAVLVLAVRTAEQPGVGASAERKVLLCEQLEHRFYQDHLLGVLEDHVAHNLEVSEH